MGMVQKEESKVCACMWMCVSACVCMSDGECVSSI